MLRWWSSLSMRTVEWVRAIGIIVIAAGALIGVVLVEGSLRAPAEQNETFDCSLPKQALWHLATNEQKVVASLEHKGARLDLWENPETDQFSLLLSWPEASEPISCFILSGSNWHQPPVDQFMQK